MRGRIRVLVNAVTVASLVLCVAIAVLWVRSYWVGEWFGYSHVDPPGRDRAVDWGFYVASGGGRIAVVRHRDVYDDRATISRQRREIYGSRWFAHSGGGGVPGSAFMARNVPTVMGVGIGVRQNVYPYGHNDNWIVTAPDGMWLAPVTVVAAVGVRRWWGRRALRRPGHCRECGYDLRATPVRCPECGAVPEGCGQGGETNASISARTA